MVNEVNELTEIEQKLGSLDPDQLSVLITRAREVKRNKQASPIQVRAKLNSIEKGVNRVLGHISHLQTMGAIPQSVFSRVDQILSPLRSDPWEYAKNVPYSEKRGRKRKAQSSK